MRINSLLLQVVLLASICTGCLFGEAADGEPCKLQEDCQNACVFDGPDDKEGTCDSPRALGDSCSRPGWWRSDCAGNLECTQEGFCACPSDTTCDPGDADAMNNRNSNTGDDRPLSATCTDVSQCATLPSIDIYCLTGDDESVGACFGLGCLHNSHAPDAYNNPEAAYNGGVCGERGACRILEDVDDPNKLFGACVGQCESDSDCLHDELGCFVLGYDPLAEEEVYGCLYP
jgi:hypothetical protein